jgi:hypothetical protein
MRAASGKEVSGGFVLSRSDTAEMLWLVKEALDQICSVGFAVGFFI